MHRVDVDLRKERHGSRNGLRDQKVLSLSHLTNLACLYEPCNVVSHKRPPISKSDERIHREKTVVSSIAVCGS